MSWPRRLLTAGALVGAGLLGYAVAHAVVATDSRGDGGPRAGIASPRHGSVGSASSTPRPLVVMDAGSGQGSAAGAVAAAVSYLELVDQAASLSGAVGRLQALTQPPFTEQALRAEAVSLALTDAVEAGGSGLVRGWRLGWRVTASTATTTRVAIWSMGLAASPSEIVAPDWSTTICMLRWSSGGWRVAGAHTVSGPTPPAPGASQAAVTAFVQSAAGFHFFGDAP